MSAAFHTPFRTTRLYVTETIANREINKCLLRIFTTQLTVGLFAVTASADNSHPTYYAQWGGDGKTNVCIHYVTPPQINPWYSGSIEWATRVDGAIGTPNYSLPIICGGDGAAGQNANEGEARASTGGYAGYQPLSINTTLWNQRDNVQDQKTQNPPPIIQDALVYMSMGGWGGGGGDSSGGYSASTGGTGAKGGDLNVTFLPGGYSSINTATASGWSSTIFLQSIGGSGGDGGSGGGNGGIAGAGGSVTFTNNVNITTNSYGIYAQSLGGWGGNGTNGGGSWWTSSNGGTGSAGGTGGAVFVTNNATIASNYGIPIFAQSVGGNGGNGGSGSSTWYGAGGSGGAGGYGGPGGAVWVANTGNLYGVMQGGYGIFAQSVGGGGGNAGSSAGLYAIGASGGYAASGSGVIVANTATIVASGSSSVGVFAQSIGGGGGAGGMAAGKVAIGGSGGEGGSGNAVNVSNTGEIYTGNSCQGVNASGICWGHTTTTYSGASNGGAFGILAQSVGGGGGSGGMGISGSIVGGGMALGGTGGNGGNGGVVYVANSGYIFTRESNSAGILAQSIGGGGGSGGGAISVSASFISAFGDAAGGDGGSGGKGDVVGINCPNTTTTNMCSDSGVMQRMAPVSGASIVTAGVGSSGILAQSIGGGGGNGGFAIALSASADASVSMAYGGVGATGGSAGGVYASPNGLAITTSGSDSPGVQIASIGGGGGNGGSAVSGAVSGISTFSVAMGVAGGGSGGGGGAGNQVYLDNTNAMVQGVYVPASSISTSGDRSYGLIAQSIGGGGGSGGASINAALSSGASVSQSIGGSGGNGQVAAQVSLYNDGIIKTSGSAASAIVAQSIGGGGGNGGTSLGISGSMWTDGMSVGGSGGAGGDGKTATLINTGNLATTGGGAPVILAQSIGGGGGNGGVTSSGGFYLYGNNTSIGGKGGSGAAGGSVNVTNYGAIIANNSTATANPGGNNPGILAQSIGGGGGNGGYSYGYVEAMANTSMFIGGTGGAAGTGLDVTVTNEGALNIQGANSAGVLAQSIGGAGGNGGTAITGSLSGGFGFTTSIGGGGGNGAYAHDVSVNSSGLVSTWGSLSPGIALQSIAGSGGNGGLAVAGGISLGGNLNGGLGGDGGWGGWSGKVTANVNTQITTTGDQSPAILAQSMGGGGGNGGNAISGSISMALSGTYTVGGNGGGGGDSGSVIVNLNNDNPAGSSYLISTNGLLSPAIVAQSIAGSGGNGGLSLAVSGSASTSGSVSVGGNGALGGTSHEVDVNVTSGAVLLTNQAQSPGILAQSIGGTGGNGGLAGGVSASSWGAGLNVGGSGGAAGDAGAVNVSNNGAIISKSVLSPGILAQSVGGTGGNGGYSLGQGVYTSAGVTANIGGGGGVGGKGDTVYAINTGSITTSDSQSTGIVAQSIGGSGGNGGLAAGGGLSQSASLTLNMGGSGGSGGQGLDVHVDNSGVISSTGSSSMGILAQSIGGSGGNGGSTIGWSVGTGTAFTANVGGAAGSGNQSSEVTVSNSNAVTTHGDQAAAIVAQSIGGSGGSGGNAISASLGSGISGAASVGGQGGSGGSANDARIALNNPASGAYTIGTNGLQSTAVLAQSIGGSGGNGGSTVAVSGSTNSVGLSTALGGKGGTGGTAGDVNISTEQKTNVAAAGSNSHAIVGQSIGGSGGNGGVAVAGSLASTATMAVSIGGGSGNGGTAGTVTIDASSASISTGGLNAVGIIGQSIGGSGGNGGNSQTLAISDPATTKAYAASASIGGSGGTGGVGNSVTITQLGAIDTTGLNKVATDGSIGILAQTIGGNGGNGGNATTNAIAGGGTVALAVGGSAGTGANAIGMAKVSSNESLHTGGISTSGMNAPAIVAQSIGGGGGNGGSSQSSSSSNKNAVAASIGGFGGGGGSGAGAYVGAGGLITTTGMQSSGIIAQSIGGGGGNGGSSSSQVSSSPGSAAAGVTAVVGNAIAAAGGNSSVVDAATWATQKAQDKWNPTEDVPDNGVSGALAVGGLGGAGGTSTWVAVNSVASIKTSGALSNGIVAQSIGGGGGNGGNATTGADGGKYSASLSVGGYGESGGSSGAVSVNNWGYISTTGNHAVGIYAQSIGGGGGSGGSSSSSSTAAAGGAAAVSFGIGGWGAMGGTGSAVTINNYGAIQTSGIKSAGIYAQSVGGGGGNGGSSSVSSQVAAGEEDSGSSEASTGGTTAAGTNASSNSSTAGNTSSGENGSAAGSDKGTAVGMTIGGFGGSGGTGGTVTVTNAGIVVTGYQSTAAAIASQAGLGLSDGSIGIFAQSVGGGGGDGGSTTSNADGSKNSVSMALGGFGGTGGNAGMVTVTNSGTVTTYGNNSTAIFAQSIGGGGGNAGSSAVTSGSGGSHAIGLGLGGRGGAAGNGADVTVNNSGYIATSGALSYGVFAQSVGGGGGNGGDVSAASSAGTSSDSGESNTATEGEDGSTSAKAKSGVSITASLGGAGGAGGNAGMVTVTNSGSIETGGIGSTAIIAQSIGGGGGNSGSSSSESNGGAYNANFALGLKGGAGGSGNGVAVNSTGSIVTNKANAMGIFAQSVGGGGGNATSNSATSSGSTGKAGISMSMGANGGSGNVGGNVTVSLNGTVQTQGANAIAVLAQSIGGGGGNGASSQSSSNGGDAAVALSLGGAGGSGGIGGAVNVYALKSIWTQGANSHGIFAQSVGGGGGNGGSSSSTSGDGGSFNANLTLGGSGVTGSGAGAVFVSTDVTDYNKANSASLGALEDQVISTTGVNSQGILAQSIGGGGGNGGDSNSSTNNSDENTSTKMVGLSLGGKSGAGGNGGTVTVNNTLAISTTGGKSEAIMAQSIGGGGGNGGSSSTGPADNASTFNLALGANGGSGGNGGLVSVTSTGSLSTAGLNASALVAQSIAGGGGSAGVTDNNSFGYASSTVNTLLASSLLGATAGTSGAAGSVTVDTSGDAITTTSHNAMGIVAQSINGGGGISSTALSYSTGAVTYKVGLGGTSVNGASANTVDIKSSNPIVTGTYDDKTGKRTGANSIGILAQSIGGGGGVSSTVLSGGSVALDPSYIGGQSSTISGQTVGSSGDGLRVTVKQMGAITTYGPAAMGIVAQSVGGGGGYASLASLSTTTVTNGSNIKIGGSSQSSGNGGEVNVTVSAPITTYGNGSVGVIAQSVGGGGGILATSGISGITPTFVGGSGNGGSVTVNVDAPITINGAGVYGVIAQSIGGGGGMLASENPVVDGSGKGGGEGGVVTVNVNKSIYVNGQTLEPDVTVTNSSPTAYGVYAKSIGTRDPSVTVAQGASVVASGGSVAIALDGLVNQLTNHGSIVSSNPQVDTAVKIVGAGGTTEIVNNGLLSGPLLNDGSVISLTNRQFGRLYLTNTPNLGGGIITNEGYLQFGLQGQIATHQVNPTGEFVQTSTGILGLNLNFAGNLSDRINVASSRRFDLAGKIQPVLVNAGMIHPGEINKTILNTGGLSNVRISDDLGVAGQTAIMSYSLSRSGENLNLHAKADFAPAGLSQFGSQVGQAIGNYQSAGSNAVFQAATAQLVNIPDVGSLDQAYQGLAGTAIQSVSQTVYQAVNQGIGSYTDRMNDWRVSTATSKASRTASFNKPMYAMNSSATNAMSDTVVASSGYIPPGRNGPWISFFQSNVYSNTLNDRIFGGSAAYEVESDQHDKMGGLGITVSQSGYSYNSAPTPITPGNSTNVGLSFYGIGRGENAYLSGIAYLGGGNTNFTRQLQTMNFYNSTNVNVMSYVAAGRVEAGYTFRPFQNEHSNIQITPFAAVQPTYIHQKSSQDNFSGVAPNFNYSATDNTAVPVYAGLELSGNHMTDGGTKISPFIRTSWMAETQQKGQMGASYNGQGVNVYFNGSPNLGNAMLYKVGSVFTANEKVSGYFTLDYDYGNASYAYRNYGVTGGIKYAF